MLAILAFLYRGAFMKNSFWIQVISVAVEKLKIVLYNRTTVFAMTCQSWIWQNQSEYLTKIRIIKTPQKYILNTKTAKVTSQWQIQYYEF